MSGISRTPRLGHRPVWASSESNRCGAGAEVHRLIVGGCQLVEDAFQSLAALRGELHLDRDALAAGEHDPVRQMLAAVGALAGELPLGHPFGGRVAVLDVQPHVVDGASVRDQADPRSPHSERGAARPQAASREGHPGRLVGEQAARLDQPVRVEASERALHRPLSTAHEDGELVGAGGVLLGDPGEQLQVTRAQQLVGVALALRRSCVDASRHHVARTVFACRDADAGRCSSTGRRARERSPMLATPDAPL